jgi:hypothetical protein
MLHFDLFPNVTLKLMYIIKGGRGFAVMATLICAYNYTSLIPVCTFALWTQFDDSSDQIFVGNNLHLTESVLFYFTRPW